VDKIRVVNHLPNTTPVQIRELLRKVWLGTFSSASCGIDWAEGTYWTVEATIEFDDGKQCSLLTDGGHVRVRDRSGEYWYMRLSPPGK
jgi:hypothetical protein